MTPIRYTIEPSHPEAHLFTVTLTVAEPDPAGQRFALPAWIPGSYMIREFARHIVSIRAAADGKAVRLRKLDKHTWEAARCSGPLTLTYEIYAWDLSVRASHLDATHGFFNGTSVFLCVEGQEHAPCRIDIRRPYGTRYRSWRVATALREATGRGGAKRYGFGVYEARDYDELIDHPVEMGEFALASFEAGGAQHDVVFTGVVPNLDLERICRDLRQVCQTQMRLFDPRHGKAPFLDMSQRYVFMTMVTTDGYGGLEHRASTALICARGDLPVIGKPETTDGYRTFLGLCSHEYFHTWNVKRIKPAAFVPYALAAETYTPLLWLFEGFTSYYDDLTLVRSGLITPEQYLGLLAKTWNGVLRGSGRRRQSVAESSFDAWTKYYRQDENAPNAIVSYYAKGALVALVLDLTIRSKTAGKRSLDDVMRALWTRYGQDFYAPQAQQRGVTLDDVLALFDEISGLSLGRLIRSLTEGTGELPLMPLLKTFGVKSADAPAAFAPLGAKVSAEGPLLRVRQVLDGSPAQRAGLAADDILVALDGLRIAGDQLDRMLARYRPGDLVEIHYFRRDVLGVAEVLLRPDHNTAYRLALAPGRHALRQHWLGA
ncbi:M61 family metallopeptidase [Imbroritus primus]|uniref:M61 family metallopeptidase n=1 Tax=Imbroritus primus TaxID=3058603 RepID=A0ACD3SS93_9BURK|nr:M61 family metallopeptidase [Burkholderiaceae bacterium PBA]